MTTSLQSLRCSAATATLLLAIFATSAPAADLMLQSGFVKVDGEQIYFESVGAGETVVLSHGAGGSHAVWYQQVVLLAQKYQVITWDHRGFGRSTDVNKQASPERAVEDLKALLDHLGVTSAHLVGQSMGGYTVMGFALKYPTRVRSMVLADTPGGVLTPEVASWRKSAPQGVPPDQLPITRHPGLSDAFGTRDPAKAFLYKQMGAASPAGLYEKTLKTSYALDDVRRISFPVLLVVGAEDQTYPPAVIRSIAALIKGARLAVLPGAGDSPYFETPEAWNAVVMKFLEG
jgi:3-oxoadipate enol-lactonase